MKKMVLAAVVLVAGITGCAGIPGFGWLTKAKTEQVTTVTPAHREAVRVVEQQPPQVTVITQVVAGATVYVTNLETLPPIVRTNIVIVPERVTTATVTNGFEVNSRVTGALTTAESLNAALNPTPTEPAVNMLLKALGGIAGVVAVWQTKRLTKANATVDDLKPAAEALNSVVKAVELFKGGTPDVLKAQIQAHATMDGVQDDLHDVVKEVTSLVKQAA